jgi:site-specific DNA-methyltransferase (adenine-specific)
MREFYNEDCMEGMKRYPDKFFELAIVDPPYGIGESMKKRTGFSVKQKNGSTLLVNENIYQKKDWDSKPADKEYFSELLRVSKHQIIWGENYFDFSEKINSSGRIIWDKINGDSDFSDCEIAWTNLFSSTRQIEFMWAGMMQGSISNGRIQEGNKKLNEKRIHPTQKPVQLYKWLLQNYAKPGDKILDTHVGSASSLIAFEEMGFDYVGFEIDSEYYQNAVKRINTYRSQLKLF